MADEEKKDQLATDEGVDDVVDFDEETRKFEKKEHNKEFAQRRIADKEEKTPVMDEEAFAEKIANRILPKIQAHTDSTLIDTKLDNLTDDPALKKLIKFHLENTVNPSVGSIDDRLEIAYAAANRKKILKTVSELKTAQKNRQQIANNGQGQGTETQKVSDGLLADAQVKELKARGWSEAKIERFKNNLAKNSGR